MQRLYNTIFSLIFLVVSRHLFIIIGSLVRLAVQNGSAGIVIFSASVVAPEEVNVIVLYCVDAVATAFEDNPRA